MEGAPNPRIDKRKEAGAHGSFFILHERAQASGNRVGASKRADLKEKQEEIQVRDSMTKPLFPIDEMAFSSSFSDQKSSALHSEGGSQQEEHSSDSVGRFLPLGMN